MGKMSAVRMKAPGRKLSWTPLAASAYPAVSTANRLEVIYLLLYSTRGSPPPRLPALGTPHSHLNRAAPADFCRMVLTLPLDGIAFCVRSQPR